MFTHLERVRDGDRNSHNPYTALREMGEMFIIVVHVLWCYSKTSNPYLDIAIKGANYGYTTHIQHTQICRQTYYSWKVGKANWSNEDVWHHYECPVSTLLMRARAASSIGITTIQHRPGTWRHGRPAVERRTLARQDVGEEQIQHHLYIIHTRSNWHETLDNLTMKLL